MRPPASPWQASMRCGCCPIPGMPSTGGPWQSRSWWARWQPSKLAAMEGQFRTEAGAPLRIGGWPDEAAAETRYAIVVPRALSLLVFHDPGAEVKGLDAFPRNDWPPVAPVHFAFQVMVGLGVFMALVAAWALVLMAQGGDLSAHRWFL